MIRWYAVATLLGFSGGLSACTTPSVAPQEPTLSIHQQWKLVWADEFEGTSLDPTRWQYETGTGAQYGLDGWGNRELQTYTDRPDNVLVHNGMLQIVARREQRDERDYTSGRILTRNRFTKTYGRFEVRLRVPPGRGLWPAFWLLGANLPQVGWPACGEIDVMESNGQQPWLVYGTVHGPGYSGAQGIGSTYTLPGTGGFSDDFHVFAVEWQKDTIDFFVDGNHYHRAERGQLTGAQPWVFDGPMYLLLNLAVGGNFAGPVSASFPQSLTVDYVRVYEPSP
ncbi:MAG: glycoside hydrolase family 16 protein [Polyangiaceae bacterium]|nr:glycoside hydrolase family 16 protein [Polyangiaceae bacterium]